MCVHVHVCVCVCGNPPPPSLSLGSGSSAIYNSELFTTRAIILKKYVDEDTSLQVQVLYALQVAVTKLEHPPSEC